MTLALITPRHLRDEEPHHDQAPRADEQDHARDGEPRWLRVRRWSSSSPGTRGSEYEAYHFFHARAAGPFCVGLDADDVVQRACPAGVLVQEDAASIPVMFLASILINVGMWFERFVIIVTSLYRDFLPSLWAIYQPTLVDIFTYMGTLGLFFTCFLLFIRWIPDDCGRRGQGRRFPQPIRTTGPRGDAREGARTARGGRRRARAGGVSRPMSHEQPKHSASPRRGRAHAPFVRQGRRGRRGDRRRAEAASLSRSTTRPRR